MTNTFETRDITQEIIEADRRQKAREQEIAVEIAVERALAAHDATWPICPDDATDPNANYHWHYTDTYGPLRWQVAAAARKMALGQKEQQS